MKEAPKHPGINFHKLPVGFDFAGVLFALSAVVVLLVGVPLPRPFLIGALVVGGALAVLIHYMNR